METMEPLDCEIAPPSMASLFASQREAFQAEPMPTLKVRLERISRVERLLRTHRDELLDIVSSDFGHRSTHETYGAEITSTLFLITYMRKHLASWVRDEPRPMPWLLFPARGHVRREPKGVVGVIGPWNYPLTLVLSPMVTALAAGNRVMIKPSEFMPRTAEWLARRLGEIFPTDLVAVVQGGVDVAQDFSGLPWDHLMFTGSTTVGRHVLAAAAKNLVPVTLELGGKSPVLVHRDMSPGRAARRVLWGKCYNSGQTCVAPDYALIHDDRVDDFIAALKSEAVRQYPTIVDNPDYTTVISDRHYARLGGLLDEAAASGAEVIPLHPDTERLDPADRRFAPHVVRGASDAIGVMQEEIFGPILPIVPYKTLEEACAYINARPRPLALYVFDDNKRRQRWVMDHTCSGGVGINEVVLQFISEGLPFGGIGPSGMGSYHGVEGFDSLSHHRAVFTQSRVHLMSLITPPYTSFLSRLFRFISRR